MSVNIELPSSQSLKLLAPQKSKEKILKPMNLISKEIQHTNEEKKIFKNASLFVPGGQSTQLIVGATKENDIDILNLSESLYNKFSLKRVYYSAYIPINRDNKLPNIMHPPTLREHRLYQGDWLLRFYGFKAKELLNENNPNFDDRFDPKTYWALNNLDDFPVEINKAPYQTLLRVPGIGVRSAKKIVAARRVASLNFQDLKKLGIVLKRAQYFVTCSGRYYGDTGFDKVKIEDRLTPMEFKQLSFFTSIDEDIVQKKKEEIKLLDSKTSVTGEI